MLIEHLLELGEDEAISTLSIGDLDAFYRAARTKFDADDAFKDRSRARVVLLQSGETRPDDCGGSSSKSRWPTSIRSMHSWASASRRPMWSVSRTTTTCSTTSSPTWVVRVCSSKAGSAVRVPPGLHEP